MGLIFLRFGLKTGQLVVLFEEKTFCESILKLLASRV